MSTSPADVTNQAQQQPAVLGGVVAYLQVDGAAAAADLYVKALDAKIVTQHPADAQGRTMHIHLYINGASVMLGDAFPEHGHPLQKPAAFNLMLPVKDIDTQYKRAVDAGFEAVMPPQDMFWGDRYGQLRDRFGVPWSMNQGKKP